MRGVVRDLVEVGGGRFLENFFFIFWMKRLSLLCDRVGGAGGGGSAASVDAFRLEDRLDFVEGLRGEGREENCLGSVTAISAIDSGHDK